MTGRDYTSLKSQSCMYNETNDCAVIAVAAVTGVSYAEAHEALKKQGRKDRQGAFRLQTFRALAALGFDVDRKGCHLRVNEKRDEQLERYGSKGLINTRTKRPVSLTTKHVNKFNEVWRDGKTYLVSTSGHVAAIVNGELFDWSDDRSLRIRALYEVTPR